MSKTPPKLPLGENTLHLYFPVTGNSFTTSFISAQSTFSLPGLIMHGFTIAFNFFQYEKPGEILAMEKQLITELKKMKALKDGDVECNPS